MFLLSGKTVIWSERSRHFFYILFSISKLLDLLRSDFKINMVVKNLTDLSLLNFVHGVFQ